MKISTWRASSRVCVARKRLLPSSGAALIRPEDAPSAQVLDDDVGDLEDVTPGELPEALEVLAGLGQRRDRDEA